ncbi:PAAR domain-containing protein [Dyella sp.]|uniref:PAAR domain-containing protein n=1 Tax=Dyella sp. TaxID=1869338 RepID=UPI002B45E2CE|nr:PAAR domain-containing protein [Dyella sp.]HKT27466.1 PAAR domain-containing protein [Dyella sp.]
MSKQPAARVGDPIDHGGQITTGSPDVKINGIAAGVVQISQVDCNQHPSTQQITKGAPMVFINGKPAGRVGSQISCGAQVTEGSPDVFIGD